MSRILLTLAVAVALTGCGKKDTPKPPADTPPPPGPTEPTTPTTPTAGPAVDDKTAAEDLKQLAIAYQNFLDASGRPPAKPADLLPFVEDNKVLIGKVESGPYVLYMGANVATLPGGSSKTVLGYVKTAATNGGVVLFADGAVKTLTAEEFAAIPKAGK